VEKRPAQVGEEVFPARRALLVAVLGAYLSNRHYYPRNSLRLGSFLRRCSSRTVSKKRPALWI